MLVTIDHRSYYEGLRVDLFVTEELKCLQLCIPSKLQDALEFSTKKKGSLCSGNFLALLSFLVLFAQAAFVVLRSETSDFPTFGSRFSSSSLQVQYRFYPLIYAH